MGFFSGLKRSWKDGSLMNNLQAAGAIANGDYATAAQIKSLYQRQRDEEAEKQAKAQAAQAAVAALVRQGIPEADAVVLVQSGAADNVLAGRFGQESQSPMVRDVEAWQKMTPEQKAAYSQMMQERAGPASINLPNGGFYYGRPGDLPSVLGMGKQQGGGKTIVRTGRDASGRQVIQYSDGSIEYAGGAASNGGGSFPGGY